MFLYLSWNALKRKRWKRGKGKKFRGCLRSLRPKARVSSVFCDEHGGLREAYIVVVFAKIWS